MALKTKARGNNPPYPYKDWVTYDADRELAVSLHIVKPDSISVLKFHSLMEPYRTARDVAAQIRKNDYWPYPDCQRVVQDIRLAGKAGLLINMRYCQNLEQLFYQISPIRQAAGVTWVIEDEEWKEPPAIESAPVEPELIPESELIDELHPTPKSWWRRIYERFREEMAF